MPENAAPAKAPDPNNPYNIDYARERRLKRLFQVTIGIGFACAAVLLILGYAMDIWLEGKTPDIAPVTPYSTPAQPANTPVEQR